MMKPGEIPESPLKKRFFGKFEKLEKSISELEKYYVATSEFYCSRSLHFRGLSSRRSRSGVTLLHQTLPIQKY